MTNHPLILVAEDDPVCQKMIRLLAAERDWMVDMVGTGKEALEAVKTKRYSLVLMDIQMPEMDGLTATRRIRSFIPRSQLPIIAMTALPAETHASICREAGMDAYLQKPIRLQNFYNTVQPILSTEA